MDSFAELSSTAGFVFIGFSLYTLFFIPLSFQPANSLRGRLHFFLRILVFSTVCEVGRKVLRSWKNSIWKFSIGLSKGFYTHSIFSKLNININIRFTIRIFKWSIKKTELWLCTQEKYRLEKRANIKGFAVEWTFKYWN